MTRTESVTFEGGSGQSLAGKLVVPASAPRAWALFAHCFTCSKDLAAARRVSEALAQRGFGVLRFDFTGLGESSGEFADTNFSTNVADLVAAAGWLEREHGAPALLVGHSLGGAAVLAAASELERVKAVATIGAPAEPVHVRKLVDAAAPDLSERGEAEVLLAGRRFRIKNQFLEDLAAQDLATRIGGLRRALLVLHAPHDQIVGIDNAREIFVAAKHPKSFVSLDGADHLLSRAQDAAYAGEVIASWAARYLPEEDPADAPPEGKVVVSGTRARFRTEVAVGRHTFVGDEPVKVGGTDLGPTPYDFLLAALGTCTSMTLRMYADRKGWPLETVRVDLSHRKVHAKDCDDCETTQGRVDELTREISITGELDDEQRKRILEIADRCPVHRTLEGEIKIRTV